MNHGENSGDVMGQRTAMGLTDASNRVGNVRDSDFGQALHAVKHGCRIQRKGWNGPGQFVFLNDGSDPAAPADRASKLAGIPARLFAHGDTGTTRRMPNLVLRTVDGATVPWVPSQTDVLAEDWLVV